MRCLLRSSLTILLLKLGEQFSTSVSSSKFPNSWRPVSTHCSGEGFPIGGDTWNVGGAVSY